MTMADIYMKDVCVSLGSDIWLPTAKKRGRKPGVKTGPRIGSRPWQLINMKAGDQLFLKAGNGASRLMQQIQSDIGRNGLTKQFTLRHIIGVAPSNSEVIHIVEVTRFIEEPQS